MDVEGFLTRLDETFLGDPASGVLRESRWADLAGKIVGFTSPAELAVLNAAAHHLGEDECYLEVGSFHGRSLCGATQDIADRTFYVLENFLEFGMEGAEARNELFENIHSFCSGADVRLLEGDCFDLMHRPGLIQKPVGVYFYDGGHSRLAHYLALGVAEPLLADDAIVLVDDASWPVVVEATETYVARHPGWEVVRRFDAATNDDPVWANGLWVLRYRRPVGDPGELPADVRWRRRVQTRVRTPAARAVYRTLRRYPSLVPVAKRLVGTSDRKI